jgi:hypothetical protein
MEESCPFQSNKKEDVIQHIGNAHETVFRIAKELFPNWILTETESTSSKVPAIPMESASNDVPQTSTPLVPSQVSQSTATPQISSSLKRRSTELELNETDLKKQKNYWDQIVKESGSPNKTENKSTNSSVQTINKRHSFK